MKYTILFLLLFLITFKSGSQIKSIKAYEDSLMIIGKAITNSDNYFNKKILNERFTKLLENALKLPNAFSYPFDSLIFISRLTSADKRIKVFTWTLPKEDGKYYYFGFVLINKNNKGGDILICLNDKSDSIKDSENSILSSSKWIGALYYKIILNKYKKEKYYTLLGWQGNDKFSRKKIIEILTINKYDEAIFGAAVFQTERSLKKRIVFQYSSQAVMSLRYEQQYYNKIRGESIYAYDNYINKKANKNASPGKIKKKKASMIVFDRLMPLFPVLENSYQYYIPSTDYYDAFIFKGGKWRLIYDIDARNPEKNVLQKK